MRLRAWRQHLEWPEVVSGRPAALEAQPALSSGATPSVAEDEVVVKKRALKHMKQQVSALLRGEDLPEGAQAREVAEVPYEVPVLSPEGKQPALCAGRSSRPTTG